MGERSLWETRALRDGGDTNWTRSRRRDLLAAATGVWLGGWTSRTALSAPAASRKTGRARSVIFLVANGGQSQIDIWDPKPEAPREIRGDFAAIRTSSPGTLLSEHLPRLARRADRFALIRSMSHEDLDHGSALYLTLTGQYHARRSSNPPAAPTDWPTHGAVVKGLRPATRAIETAININGPALVPIIVGPGQFAGFLGPDLEPMMLGDVTAEATVLPGLAPLRDVPPSRRALRERLRQQLEPKTSYSPSAIQQQETLHGRALELLEQPAVQFAFDLDRESVATRQRYGLDRSGQACLLARRLVEADVPWITVFWNHCGRGQDLAPNDASEYGWDTHNDVFMALKDRLLPRFDLSVSALLDDLQDRGLLESTLVVCAGEFGRAPLVALEKNFTGESPGRKHWGACYSVMCAGAGVTPGAVVGASDRHGAYPASESWGPWDLTATMFAALGIEPDSHFLDKAGRRFPVTSGRVIDALYR